MQVRVWQAVSAPGQSIGPRHSTHWPLPSHWLPPELHALPTAVGLCAVVPSGLHTSSVHSLLSSTGTHGMPPVPPEPPVIVPAAPPVVVPATPPVPAVPAVVVPAVPAVPPLPPVPPEASS